jgi:hypothetical protein
MGKPNITSQDSRVTEVAIKACGGVIIPETEKKVTPEK